MPSFQNCFATPESCPENRISASTSNQYHKLVSSGVAYVKPGCASFMYPNKSNCGRNTPLVIVFEARACRIRFADARQAWARISSGSSEGLWRPPLACMYLLNRRRTCHARTEYCSRLKNNADLSTLSLWRKNKQTKLQVQHTACSHFNNTSHCQPMLFPAPTNVVQSLTVSSKPLTPHRSPLAPSKIKNYHQDCKHQSVTNPRKCRDFQKIITPPSPQITIRTPALVFLKP